MENPYVVQDSYSGEFYVVSNDNSDPAICSWKVHAGPFSTAQEACSSLNLGDEFRSKVEEAIELMEGYVDTKDTPDGPGPNDAMLAVQLLQDALKAGRKSAPHRFSNRKEVRQQFVPGLKLSNGERS